MPIPKRAGKNAFKPMSHHDLKKPKQRTAKSLAEFIAERTMTTQTHFVSKARSLGLTASEATKMWRFFLGQKK